jgi:precorrin-6Y C5,15-methyltransferase (decarboxylating)
MIPIHVIGIGLDGPSGLTNAAQQIVEQASLLVGSSRHLSYFPTHSSDRMPLNDFTQAIAQIHTYLSTSSPSSSPPSPPPSHIAILTSGDPLFFGLGRLLLEEFPAEQLTFHPHLSSIQLAFSRIKLPWQDARFISSHGRSLDELTQALQQGVEKIAVLTDGTNTPGAIAHLLQSLDSPTNYKLWVCENLGGSNERIVETTDLASLETQPFAPLNVVILQRIAQFDEPLDAKTLPLLGIPDHLFSSFSDRPGLMTKREVRVQILGELGLQPAQIVWDIGAGTGSISIEIARLCPNSQIYAIEKTAIGSKLIEKNCQRFQVSNVLSVHGSAPNALYDLPQPDRIFVGGSGGNLIQILNYCAEALSPNGRIVLALATLEHLSTAVGWLKRVEGGNREDGGVEEVTEKDGRFGVFWSYRLLQVHLSRSIPIASLTRFSPLNPVTLVVAERCSQGGTFDI